MLQLERTTPHNLDFVAMVAALNKELAALDGEEEHAFYMQFNQLDDLTHVIVAYQEGKAVCCGALKPFSTTHMEVKRMFTPPKFRKNGFALNLLSELERWAKELGFSHCILETGKRQPVAVAMYHRAGYHVIPNYGQYATDENSICFEKQL